MNNQTLSDEAKFMSAYLAQHGTCSSWDFDADYNFAVQFGTNDEKELIQDAMRSSAPFSHIIAVWENCWKKSITERRLKALRVLVQHGFARSTWTGLGEGSYNSFGRSRVRSYLHVSAYKEPLTTASKGDDMAALSISQQLRNRLEDDFDIILRKAPERIWGEPSGSCRWTVTDPDGNEYLSYETMAKCVKATKLVRTQSVHSRKQFFIHSEP